MGLSEPHREIQVEPLRRTAPQREPSKPAPAPKPTPERKPEKVPA